MNLDEAHISAAADMNVWDKKGDKQRFGDLFGDKKVIAVFIRHFFCGNYVAQLAQVPSEAIEAAGTSLVIIGCGEWQLIENYQEATGFTGAIYANPSRDIYKELGMTFINLKQTPSGEKKRSYVGNAVANAMYSMWKGPILQFMYLGRQGNMSQNGGDFIFGPGNQCSYSHIMKHTQDHVEAADLMQAAGVKYP